MTPCTPEAPCHRADCARAECVLIQVMNAYDESFGASAAVIRRALQAAELRGATQERDDSLILDWIEQRIQGNDFEVWDHANGIVVAFWTGDKWLEFPAPTLRAAATAAMIAYGENADG